MVSRRVIRRSDEDTGGRRLRQRHVVTSKGKTYVRARAALRLFAEDLDPSEVTRVLKLPPDHAHRKGDLRIGRTKKGKVQVYAPYPAGRWSMSSESWVTSRRFEVHLHHDQIQPKADALALILARGSQQTSSATPLVGPPVRPLYHGPRGLDCANSVCLWRSITMSSVKIRNRRRASHTQSG